MQSKKLKRYNFLLKLAVANYCLFLLLYFSLDLHFQYTAYYHDINQLSPVIQYLGILIIAPIIEELIFRGPLLYKKRIWTIVLLLFAFLNFIFNITEVSLSSLVLLLWSLVVAIDYFVYNSKTGNYIIWFSILAFALSHLSFEELKTVEGLLIAIFYFASSCLLTWIVISFGLLKSTLFHIFYNLFALSVYVFVIHFSGNKATNISCVENSNICIEWQKVGYFSTSKPTITYKESAYEATSASIRNVLDLLTEINKENKKYLILDDWRIKYNIEVLNPDNEILEDLQILKALEAAELIKIEHINRAK